MMERTRGSRRKGARGAAPESLRRFTSTAIAPLVMKRPARRRRRAGREVARSANRHGVLEPPVGPESILATVDLERCALAEIRFEHLAVIADLRDDLGAPVRWRAEALAHLALDAQEAPDVRVGAVGLEILDVARIHAELLRLDHGIERPAYD